jgi:hypothetical protein
VTLSDNRISSSSQNSLGLSSTVNYNRRIHGWGVGGSFGYAQNAQTALISYTTSNYNYSANIRRRWGRLGWSAGLSGTQTLLTEEPGQNNTSKSVNTAINYSHWVTANANYAKSNGTAVQGAYGFIQNPILPGVIPNSELLLFNGDSYSFSLSSSPIRRMTLGASYSKALTNSTVGGISSLNNSKMLNAIVNYQFRKMYFTGGYSNLVQGFSASGLPPQNISSFYVGISRWFNFF